MNTIDNDNPATWPMMYKDGYYRLVNHAARYATAGFITAAAVEHYKDVFHSPARNTAAHGAMRERYNVLYPSPNSVLGNTSAAHLYEVDTTAGRIDVHAQNRRIAQGYAIKAGYDVKSINMVG